MKRFAALSLISKKYCCTHHFVIIVSALHTLFMRLAWVFLLSFVFYSSCHNDTAKRQAVRQNKLERTAQAAKKRHDDSLNAFRIPEIADTRYRARPAMRDFNDTVARPAPLMVGAERLEEYLHLLHGKNVALVVNPTSMIGHRHLVDTLSSIGVKLVKVFAPEHGFRGTGNAGEHVAAERDEFTGISVISLYGQKTKPSTADLSGIDIVVYDIQDVGVRFYTYISTLHYVMEACAENGVPLLVLDRPNPNGHYVDGPVLKPELRTFVGVDPIPVVHGLTIGEYALMINGENWLTGGKQCALTVVPCSRYNHRLFYNLPVKPSPNLPTMRAIYLYPSLCLFEGTCVGVGRGTDLPFESFGHPDAVLGSYSFMPAPNSGAKKPLHEGRTCRGFRLDTLSIDSLRAHPKLDLSYICSFYNAFPDKSRFFLHTNFFGDLIGNNDVKYYIQAHQPPEQIRQTWQPELTAYKEKRRRYLLYPDFE